MKNEIVPSVIASESAIEPKPRAIAWRAAIAKKANAHLVIARKGFPKPDRGNRQERGMGAMNNEEEKQN